MKNSSYFKIASTLLVLSVFAGCASLPIQQNEYDDVYFTSADRTQPKKVVFNPDNSQELGADVITLEKSSPERIEADLISKYNNGATSEVVYFEESEPRVTRPSELNYVDFVADYNDNQLQNYDLPLDWEDMDAFTFNQILRDDLRFRNAWYEQYYEGNTAAMDSYARNPRNFNGNNRNSNFNVNVGLGFGFGSFYSPFRTNMIWGDPFYNGFYDSFWSVGFNRPLWAPQFSPWGFNSFHDPFFFNSWNFNAWNFNSWRFNSWNNPNFRWRRNGWNNWGGNTIIIADNNFRNRDDYTRGGRIRSTSVTSVRTDANNGARTRSSVAANNNSSRTRSTISSGRVSNSSVRSSGSAVRSSRSSVDEALARSGRRVNTDAFRFDNRTRSTSSTARTSSSRSSFANRSLTRTSSSSRLSLPTYSRSSRSSSTNSRGISFDRSSSSRSSGSIFSRGTSSSSNRSSGVRSSSSGSSSRSTGGSVRSSSSSGGSSRSSGSSSSSSRSGSSSSSRSGRGN